MNTTKIVICAVGAAAIALAALWVNYESWVTIPRIRAHVAAQFRDPVSTQFRNDRIAKLGPLCGEVNSKNGNGGYVGFSRFIYQGADAPLYVEGHALIGRESTEDVIKRMDRIRAILVIFNGMNSQDPSARPPSEAEREELANQEIFDAKWKSLCQ